jgi:hypothetical protein
MHVSRIENISGADVLLNVNGTNRCIKKGEALSDVTIEGVDRKKFKIAEDLVEVGEDRSIRENRKLNLNE